MGYRSPYHGMLCLSPRSELGLQLFAKGVHFALFNTVWRHQAMVLPKRTAVPGMILGGLEAIWRQKVSALFQ